MIPDIVGLLSTFTDDPSSPLTRELQRAIYVARMLQERGTALQTNAEKRQQRELELMMSSETVKPMPLARAGVSG